MLSFQEMLKEFKVSYEDLMEEIEEFYTGKDPDHTEVILHRIVEMVNNVANLVDYSDKEEREYLNREWPAQAISRVVAHYKRLVKRVDRENREIFQMEFTAILNQVKPSIQISDVDLSKPAEKIKLEDTGADPAGADLRSVFFEHLKGFMTTAFCREMLRMISAAVVDARQSDQGLLFQFSSSHAHEVILVLSLPQENPWDEDDMPPSFWDLTQLHPLVSLSWDGHKFIMGPDQLQPGKMTVFATINDHVLAWDRSKKNKMGEPLMVCRHGDRVDPLPQQNLLGYGAAGMLVRVLGWVLYPDAVCFRGYL